MLTIVTPPELEPLSLDEAKAHLRVFSDDDDEIIDSYISGVTKSLDGRDGLLGCCLITQTWKLVLPRFRDPLSIPLPPCQSIDAFTYMDSDGVSQTLSEGNYSVFGLGTVNGATLRPLYGQNWPSTRDVTNAVTITFTAGFGDAPDEIPQDIRTSIAMRVANLFDTGLTEETPTSSDLVYNYRRWPF